MKTATTMMIATLVFLLTGHAMAADLDLREHVEVVGNAEVKVVPNEFVIRTTIQKFDDDLDDAAEDNEKTVRKAFQKMRKLGVDRRYIVADEVRVNKVTEGYRPRGDYRVLGYNVTREVTVILHDSSKLERAMKGLFSVGVDQLTLSTGNTEMEKYLQAAQVEAAKNARKKGGTMVAALGRTVGKAVAIEELAAPQQNAASNFVYQASTPDLGDALSLGKIKVRASIKVKFLLGE